MKWFLCVLGLAAVLGGCNSKYARPMFSIPTEGTVPVRNLEPELPPLEPEFPPIIEPSRRYLLPLSIDRYRGG